MQLASTTPHPAALRAGSINSARVSASFTPLPPRHLHDVIEGGSAVVPHGSASADGANMSKPVIFTISAAWDDEASVWSGHCDDIPAAARADARRAAGENIGDGPRPLAGQSP